MAKQIAAFILSSLFFCPFTFGAYSMERYLQLPTAERYGLFEQLSRKLDQDGNGGVNAVSKVIPGFAKKLKIAKTVSAAYWTDSLNVDEQAKQNILPVRLLESLGIEHRVAGGVMRVSAGQMHTYGYLFSQLRTSHGLKGKRWIESRLDERLGIPAGTFSPFAPGEFLSNVTAVLDEVIPFPVSARPAPALGKILEKDMMPGLKASFERLKLKERYQGAVIEHVTWKMPDSGVIKADVRTHLVALDSVRDMESADTHLLVYDVAFQDKHRRFVTTFPVNRDFAESIKAAKPVEDTGFAPRFNLYIDPSWIVVSHECEGFKKGR